MTDHHDPLDELASAHLDGQTSSEEAARIHADPDLQARLARLGATRDAVRSEVPAVAEERREAAIQAALAAYDALDSPIVTPITAAASRRRTTRTLGLVGAAAALALLALVVPLLDRLDDGGSRDQVLAPTAGDTSDASRSAASGGALAEGQGPASTGTIEDSAAAEAFAGPPTDDLGAHDDLPSLTDAVRADLAARKSASGDWQEGGADTRCNTEPDTDGVVVYRAWATLDGRDVVALVREDSDGGRTLVVLDRQDCSRVAGGKL